MRRLIVDALQRLGWTLVVRDVLFYRPVPKGVEGALLYSRGETETRLEIRGGEEHVLVVERLKVDWILGILRGDRVRAASSAKGHRRRNTVREMEQRIILFFPFSGFFS